MLRSNFKRIPFVVLAIMGVILTLNISSALAIDQTVCGPPEHDPPGAQCVGRLELHELGSFDANGAWQWNITDQDLLADIALNAIFGDRDTCNWSNEHPECTLLTPTKNEEITITWAVLRNRRAPSDQYRQWSGEPDSSMMLEGTVDTMYIPHVQKYYDSENDAFWFEVMHNMKPEAIESCEAQNWQWEPGDGSPCDWWHEEIEPDLPRHDNGVSFYPIGTPLTEDNVQNITWEGGNKTVGVRDNAVEHGLYMKYDMGQNILQETGRGVSRTLYMDSFGEIQCPSGIHTFILTLKDGRSKTFRREVLSDRLMPVVPATKTVSMIERITKSGKSVSQGPEVQVANMTAREIIDEDGAARLLIQWAEPDLAMMFSEYMKDVRLRIWVGDGWANIPASNHVYFLWVDVPVHSGSVVIPPEQYAWVKQQVSANGGTNLTISGQYREQFGTTVDPHIGGGFHNRGYMGYIFSPINN